MNKYIIGAIIAIILFVGGIFIGKYYFSKTDIQIKEKIVYKTEYKTKIEYVNNQENFDALWNCYKSPILFKEKTENNNLFVTAFDDCKQATAKYEIGTKGNWKIYAGIGFVGIIGGGIIAYRILK